MKRLITFGCSHTFGHYLPDEQGSPNTHLDPPSKFAWPFLLSNKLGYSECYNEAQCGASNIEILNKLIMFNYAEHDVVIVLWSYLKRDTIFHSDTDYI